MESREGVGEREHGNVALCAGLCIVRSRCRHPERSRGICTTNRQTPVEAMRIVMMVAGVLLLFVGAVWILQGINVLPGSFMTGQMKWAVIGAITLVIGIVLIVLARRPA